MAWILFLRLVKLLGRVFGVVEEHVAWLEGATVDLLEVSHLVDELRRTVNVDKLEWATLHRREA
jgi:hypothetical protein